MKKRIEKILRENPQGLKAKEIARLLSDADRTSVNQVLYANPSLFAVNSSYEWTLKSKPSVEKKPTPARKKSETEIRELFKGADICDKDMVLLKGLNNGALLSVSEHYQALKRYLHMWDSDDFGVALQRALIKSEDEFEQILGRTERMRQVRYIDDSDLWVSIVFSPNFDALLSHARKLLDYNTQADFLWDEMWLEIVSMPPVQFDAFMNNLRSLSEIAPDMSLSEQIRNVQSEGFATALKHAQKLKALCDTGAFPLISDWDYRWKAFVKASDVKFNKYLGRCRKIYAGGQRVVDEVVLPNDPKQTRFLDVLLLSDADFDALYDNLTLCTRLPILTPLSNHDWFDFYLQKQRKFAQCWKRTQILNDAVEKYKLPCLAVDDWKAYMEVSLQEFESKLEHLTKEHQIVLESLRNRNRARRALGEDSERTVIKQCFGDCGTCRREKCVLEEE